MEVLIRQVHRSRPGLRHQRKFMDRDAFLEAGLLDHAVDVAVGGRKRLERVDLSLKART
jgi:hypothetical protein